MERRKYSVFFRVRQVREFGRMIREGDFDDPAPAADAQGHDPTNPVPIFYGSAFNDQDDG
jgi:hypothetical protein